MVWGVTERKQHEAFLSRPDTNSVHNGKGVIYGQRSWLPKIQSEHLTAFFLLWFTYLF